MTIVEVRRLHIFTEEAMQVRCPDCNYRFFDVVESGGCNEVKCKCGNKWLLVFHDSVRELYEAVRIETGTKDLTDYLSP
jgi:DNA-directed RNA polymerase subunit RPC12/RpoP